MTKIRYIAIMAMVIIFATTAVFVGCEKKENPVVEQRKDALKRQKEQQIIGGYLVQWSPEGYKGHGRLGNKVCVADGKRCFLWFRQELEAGMTGPYIGLRTSEERFEADEVVSGIPSNPEPGNNNFPKRILVEFPNEWNNATALDDFFEGRYDVFVLEEAMVEGGESLLAEMLGVDFPCIIKAGEYPMYMNGEGNYVVELMVEQFFFEIGTNPALKLRILDQENQWYDNGIPYAIYAEFLREWNDNPEAIHIMQHFYNMDRFIVNEDIIVDEDSYLFEIFPYPCVIRAGEYSIYTEDEENFVIEFIVDPL